MRKYFNLHGVKKREELEGVIPESYLRHDELLKGIEALEVAREVMEIELHALHEKYPFLKSLKEQIENETPEERAENARMTRDQILSLKGKSREEIESEGASYDYVNNYK